MPFPITSPTDQQIDVTVFGTATAADGSVTHVDLRSIRVAVESGDGTFTQDPATPMVFTAKAAGAEGETVYTVTGTQQNGPEVSDTVVYTVTAAEQGGNVATGLGFEASEPEPQGPHPDQGLPQPQTQPAGKGKKG